jgi:hypothetical protein
MVVIVLLILSIGLNISLIFGIVRKNADQDMNFIRMRDGMQIKDQDDLSASVIKTNLG